MTGQGPGRRIGPMLSREFVRNNAEALKTMMANRNIESSVDLDTFMQLDEARRTILKELEELRHVKNRASEQIAACKREKNNASEQIEEMRRVGGSIKKLEEELKAVEEDFGILELSIPNLPHESVPVGRDETHNRVERTWGNPPDFPFSPRPHWELGEDLGILDFQRASKVTGARFAVLSGHGARLERALINFFLDRALEAGYTEILPPFIVNSTSLTGTGQLPKFKEDLFNLDGSDYFLVPTAEVPLTNLHRDEVLNEQDLPIYYCASTPCFRSEAGSYGKDTRGLIRQHQFNKVELVKFSRPEDSYMELESLTKDAESLLHLLSLPFRTVSLCTGDLGFAAAKTFDLEVWMPSQNTYREISSCSNFEDFQARRGGIRLKREGSKRPEYAHTLNGSALAVGRTIVALLENHQQADGSILIPEPLVPYMGGVELIEPV